MKRIVVTIALIAAVFASGAGLFAAPVYAADAFNSSNAKDQACAGINGSTKAGSCSTPGKSVNAIITSVTNFLSAIIGVAAVVMIMMGGFKYITAAGDASKAQTARNTLVYAIVGLVIVAMAQFITQFVLHQVTKK